MKLYEQDDAKGVFKGRNRKNCHHRFVAKAKRRAERRRARRNPETQAAYGRYSGWAL